MSTQKHKRYALFAIFLLLAMALACGGGSSVGELQSKSETVELGDAASAQVEIDMGAGELIVGGGAAALMEANFDYNVADAEPIVTYSNGNLSVRQSETDTGFNTLFDMDEYRNDWDLSFNDRVAMTMEVNVGAGRSELILGGLALTSVDINSGAGEVIIDLTGSPSLTDFSLGVGAGEVSVNLTGNWTNDLNATIEGGVGQLTVRLPTSVGVRVDVTSGLGGVDAAGLTSDGEYYTNDAYGESEVTLNITIQAGVGQVTLISE